MPKLSKISQAAMVVAAIVLVGGAVSSVRAATITVNTVTDGNVITFPGQPPPLLCSLRDAITADNTNLPVRGCAAGQSSGADRIVFDVGIGTPTIRLLSALPVIVEPVEIDGGTGGATRIEINGGRILAIIGYRPDGLILATGDSTIRNLVINGFSGNGIVMTAISGGYLPDHNPPTITDPSLPTNPPCDMRPNQPDCFPRGPGGGEDIPIPPVRGAGARNKIFGCFIGADKTGTIAIGNGSGINTAGIVSDTDMHTIGGPTWE